MVNTSLKKFKTIAIADTNGIAVDDEVISINGIETKGKKMNDLLSDTTGTVSIKIKKRFGTSEMVWNAVTSTLFIVYKS